MRRWEATTGWRLLEQYVREKVGGIEEVGGAGGEEGANGSDMTNKCDEVTSSGLFHLDRWDDGIVLSAIAKRGELHEAEEVQLIQTEQTDVVPLVFQYNLLIQGHCQTGALDKALNLFQTMLGKGQGSWIKQ
ncbi:hypothetical protein SUGI_0102570 [Cryptomeria japonica]|nr:hypothetical protein SUGI_0102570 [Cryptomeria japonica]